MLLFCLAPALSPAAAQPDGAAAIATASYGIGGFTLALRRDTQTAANLRRDGGADFDVLPAARAAERAGDSNVHLGDLRLRLRTPGTILYPAGWRSAATCARRAAR
ncbi:DUF5695 domain-containing protein [Sphingomonas phyllosphaerae]|uniref:DUF5695 domain-containing protein n=1 Tax=Sphingomonas phyllosphaerae TaxID=257003 RepID=UPI002413CB54|nr:DUF5695 domain-containing protein [Sphingomonas phyllosphaerae]